ncbi:MAG: hypothetical protein ACRYFU_09255 [Janthinobacterium lividum]
MPSCPLDQHRIVEEYFAESRNHLLELAAFFDRLDRARDTAGTAEDFRVTALKYAAALLLQPGPQRVKRMALVLSDPTEDPRDGLDRKAAWGAFTPDLPKER